ncbi:secretin and TonB N-terminal domain-containing protein [Hymenobacter sp. B81]|uniref:secretin and TonB N-terminal domain-containing protein n=1 Tax=Hymenobacter sp. B81 TaxID=3344878 RepID=UPI0037DDB096
MRNRICLAAAVLWALAGDPARTLAQTGSVMERRVTVTFNQAPLESVLRTLRKQYGVRISYSNTALNLRQPVTLSVQNQPLRQVLDQLLRDKNIGYELVGDQVVLHNAPAKSRPAARPADPAGAGTTTTTVSKTVPGAAPTGASTGGSLPPRTAATDEVKPTPNTGAARPEPAKPAPQAPAPKPAGTSGKPAGSSSAGPRSTAGGSSANGGKASASKPAGSKVGRSQSDSRPTTAAKAPAKATRAPARTPTKAPGKPQGSGNTATSPARNQSARAPEQPTDDPQATASTQPAATATPAPADSAAAGGQAHAQPLAAAQDSAARAGAEPEPAAEEPARPTYRRTAQVSFLGPLGSNGLRSGQTVNSVSLNVLGGYSAGVDGVEAASLFNVARDTVKGLQMAGLVNVVGKRLQGYQGAGLANVLGGSGEGWQSAGLFNVATRPVAGAQTAGLFNYSGNAKPGAADSDFLVQAGGLFNVSLGEVRGVQAAGLFNVASQVRGVQLAGLINIADSVQGVSLAPLNFVRHGYHRLELSYSETWPVQASLKLGGSPYFYTFFSGAFQPPAGSEGRRWGVGYGLGAEFFKARRFSLTTDLMAMQVNEEQSGLTEALNLHNQLRLLVGFSPFRKGSRFRVVAGPVVSLLVTERFDTERNTVASNLSEGRSLWLDQGNSLTKVLGWVGYSTGIRF